MNLTRISLKGLAGASALSVLLLMLYGCGSRKSEDPGGGRSGERAVTIVPVNIAVAERKNLSVTKTYSGTLEGEEQANIVAKIGERVTGVNVQIGASVRAGQILITLDKSGVSSQYYQAEANFKNAEKTLERMKSLYSEGAVALSSLDGAQTAYDVAKANFDAARSVVELTSPIAGAVTAVNVSVGDLATPGAILMTIAKINRMKVIFNINEADVASVTPGQKVRVFSEANPGATTEGRIIQLSKSADVRSRSFEIKALFPNTADRWYKPGLFCKVTLQIAPREKALIIPTAAIRSDGVTNTVFVVRDGRAFQRTVQPGVAGDENTEILSGLSEHDTVATVGMNNLRDSCFVTVAGAK